MLRLDDGTGNAEEIQGYNTGEPRAVESDRMPPYRLSDPAVATFVVIPVLLAATLVWATLSAWRRSGASESASRRAAVVVGVDAAAWMALTWLAAMSGILQLWDRTPPPFAFIPLGVLIVSIILAFGRVGTRLAQHIPLWALVAIQGFRLPLELAMHALYERGIMPVQMSYSGRNFDVLTGATAIIVAMLVKWGYAGRGLVAVWNVGGLALLANVVAVAIASTPLFKYFGDDHLVTFVAYTPFVWLPAVMVVAALAGHLVIVRALRRL
jgi:hypothetical protein